MRRKILPLLVLAMTTSIPDAFAQDFYADSLAALEARENLTALRDSVTEAQETVSSYRLRIMSDSLLREASRIDSLIMEWQTALDAAQPITPEAGTQYSSDVPDSTLIRRLGEMNAFFTIPFNATVKEYMILYSEKGRAKMSHLMGLSKYYFPIFEEALDRYDMPLELKYMSIIESALNPTARSRAGARGIWQFMYNTAKSYGLRINSFVDERMDVEKAADAAARYMYDAYKTFGDWNLAICSYNCGPGNVSKAIHRAGGKKDFWSIYPFLPRETRGYVPAFVGAMYAMTYASSYGIETEEIDFPPMTDTIFVTKNLHFKQLSEKLGIPVETIRTLNPQYTHDIVPGNEGTYYLKLPFEYTGCFIDSQEEIYRHKADSLMSPAVLKSIREGGDGQSIRYKVREGDYLGRIASRYGCSVEQLKKWNGLKSTNIRVGQTLLIYTRGSAPKSTPSTDQSKSQNVPVWTGETVTYTVQQGDSFYSIAQKYPGVSYKEIQALNGGSSKLSIGQKIKIPKKS